MASIEVINVAQPNPEAPIEIQLSNSNIIYRGPEGKPGRDGVIGRDGKSAYDIAVDNGFEGTESEWLASLKGEPGSNGAPGQDGAPGATGPAGQDGATPVKGVDYFTEEDIEDFIEQIPAPDLSAYSKVIQIKSNTALNSDVVSQLREINTALAQNQPIPPYIIYLNGQVVIGLQKGSAFYQDMPKLLIYDRRGYLFNYTAGGSYDNPDYSSGQYESFDLSHQDYYISAAKSPTGGDTYFSSFSKNILLSSMLNTAYNASTNKIATMADISAAISNATSFGFEIVNSLPVSDISTSKIYLVLKPTSGTNQVYTEYIYVNGDWEIVGDTQITVSALSSQEVQTIWNTASTT